MRELFMQFSHFLLPYDIYYKVIRKSTSAGTVDYTDGAKR